MSQIWWSLPLTLLVYFATRRLAIRLRMPLLNPLLMSMVIIIPLLLVTHIPYARYFAGSKILNDLLQPAVVALAFPSMNSSTRSARAGNLLSASALLAAWSR